jgi:hypothetical protein
MIIPDSNVKFRIRIHNETQLRDFRTHCKLAVTTHWINRNRQIPSYYEEGNSGKIF